MKRIGLIFVMSCLFSSISSGQTLIEQIEHTYNTLEPVSYIDKIVLSYSNFLKRHHEIAFKQFVDIYSSGVDSSDVAEKQNIADSIYLRYFKNDHIKDSLAIKKLESKMKSETPLYVLNLELKSGHLLQVDTSRLAFNLFYFDKRCKGRLYVFCDDGEYGEHDERYCSLSRVLVRNAPKVFRKIMRKHPKYLLYCPDLEGMNTILYVIGNDIFIYRIVEMQEYKLDDYMKNRTSFMNS